MKEKTKKLFDENGVDKIKFFFVNSPLVNNVFTSCLLINSKTGRLEARGVAICSMKDTFSKSEGKNKAFGRAVMALKKKKNSFKIRASARDNEFVKRSLKVKDGVDDYRFTNEVAPELSRIDPKTPISVTNYGGKYKKYFFSVPVSYPIRLTNSLFKYKSQYRPVPIMEEVELLNSICEQEIFPEIENLSNL